MHFAYKNKMIYSSIIYIILLTILIPVQKIYAKEAYVYCSTKDRHWHWLENKSVNVSGEWVYIYLEPTKYYQFFKVNAGKDLVIDLKNRCKKEFGQDFIYAQPAEYATDYWHVFGYADNSLEPGIYDYLGDFPRFR
ncbi:hypothetical protein [Fluviispira vulneris]|uniref:hypothetical protein n=1 Tax=Fluviispira vulneris TaxID=2763012 RepID=UPI001646FDCD|nr:hypothetical protein [Fluviispira vulneris]